MKKVLYVTPHPYICCTLSTIAYNTLKLLASKEYYIVCYAITPDNSTFLSDREIPEPNVHIHKGESFAECIKLCTPDIIIINDTLSHFVTFLHDCEFYKCKKVGILPTNNNKLMDNVLNHENFSIGLHFNKMTRQEACTKLELDPECTYILNLCNNNSSRKRYDLYVQSVVSFLSLNQRRDIKFIIATNIYGYFNLYDIFHKECL